jgi:23S rRNA pseudouridine2605 synthase
MTNLGMLVKSNLRVLLVNSVSHPADSNCAFGKIGSTPTGATKQFLFPMRLNRYIASAGISSRRGADELIRAGKVTVNGHLCTDLATQVTEGDAVKVNNKLVHAERPLYVAMNKPAGYLCTASGSDERATVFDLLPPNWPRLFYVGRLDKESEGLLILTNDGDLAMKLTHPRFKVEKEYQVTLDRPFDFEQHREKLLKGFHIEGGRAKAEQVYRVSPVKLRVILKQGIKRQIRLMFYQLGYEVERLVRTRIGQLKLDVHQKEWRLLSGKEVQQLRDLATGNKPAGALSGSR